MRVLGAVIAGGQSRRFGTDKSLALLGGRRLIDIVCGGIADQVAASVVCGRTLEGWPSLDDYPVRGLGPLGGLCAALRYAKHNGFDAVLSVAADVVPVPPSLTEKLAAELVSSGLAVFVKGQHLLGLWPSALADPLSKHLEKGTDRSIYAWIAACGARPAFLETDFANINTREDLEKLSSLESNRSPIGHGPESPDAYGE